MILKCRNSYPCDKFLHPGDTPGGGDSTLIRRVCATGGLNLLPCSGVGKPKRSYRSFFKSIVLYCIVLYCIVLYCIVLYCTVLYCTVLYCTVLYCTVLYCTVLYCTVLYCTVLYCTVLYCIVLYCIVLYCIGDKDHVYALLI